tara:strand:- start:3533 stop:4291 length:759 start_codon:yes stop_codon:yes gene_type:complete
MQDKVYFVNSEGDKLCGILSDPKPNSKTTVIILCHGFNSSKESSTNTTLERIFNQKRIATFRLDFFGHGESEGEFENITITEAVDDILKTIEYLKQQGFLKIGLVGSSFGGIASIMAASKTKELFVLALKAPVSNYLERDLHKKSKEELEQWKENGYTMYQGRSGERRLNYSFFEDFKGNDGYEVAKQIKIPTIIVHGDKDESVPVEQSKKIVEIFEKGKLEIIKNADHGFSKPEDFEEMIRLISEFVIDKV